ncbi:hypothetical protein D3C73_1256860 [compost metagenome]
MIRSVGHAHPAGQHVHIHVRYVLLGAAVAQQAMHHRPQAGHATQPLWLQIGQTHRHIGAKAETKRGDALMVNPGHRG